MSDNTLSEKVLNQYFLPDASLIREGDIKAKGLKEIKQYISKLNKGMHFSPFKYIDIISVKNKVFMYFSSLTSYGDIKQRLVFIELFTFKNGKIQLWQNEFSVSTPLL